ncbi:hypothetical protein [Spirochaeta dissipatitropha]
MKKVFLLLMTMVLSGSCGLFSDFSREEAVFVVVDSSNQVLNTYEYDFRESSSPLRTVSYNNPARDAHERRFSYDERGYVSRMYEKVPGQAERVISFQTSEVYDEDGRLIQLVQTSSLGEVIETYYGYDETGRLRGTVVQTAGSTLEMKDYDSPE